MSCSKKTETLNKIMSEFYRLSAEDYKTAIKWFNAYKELNTVLSETKDSVLSQADISLRDFILEKQAAITKAKEPR